jgi:cysteinyl-tRNA synthetase
MLTFYNTLSRKKETLKSSKRAIVKIYICGSTVYDFAHLGNLRAYLFSDILVRYLNFRGYKTRSVMNITDVDDKTIKGAKAAGISLREYTKKYEQAFFSDLKSLNIQKADFYPKATECIKEIQDLIKKLWQKGYAYEKDGSVYFDISKFKKYGRLSKINLKGLKKGARVDLDQYEKESPGDFVLWKKAKPNEPFWNLKLPITYNLKPKTLFGRPGWHIECSAMAMKYLGETLDFHLGGVDLIFPHHENEIAQSEAATGKKFAKFWLHNEHLLVSGQKMAKSLGNYYTLRDLISRGFDPLAFRYLCLQSHYRSKMNFTWESLKAAERTLKEIRALGQRQKGTVPAQKFTHNQGLSQIERALDDDLDTPKALSILHKANNFRLWLKFDEVLGLNLKSQISKLKITAQISKLLKERERLRKQGKFKEADEIRKKIKEMGYEIEDTEKGPRLVVCSRP